MPFCSGVLAEVCKVSIPLRWQNRTKSSAIYSPPLSLNSFYTFISYCGSILVTRFWKTLACSDLRFRRKTHAYLVFPHMYVTKYLHPLLVRTLNGPHTSEYRYLPKLYLPCSWCPLLGFLEALDIAQNLQKCWRLRLDKYLSKPLRCHVWQHF